MTIFKSMTARQRRSVVISLAWMLFGCYMLTSITWVGVGWIVLGAFSLVAMIWQARKDARQEARESVRHSVAP